MATYRNNGLLKCYITCNNFNLKGDLTMCKIIGFTKRVDGYQTAAGFMNTELFKNACMKVAGQGNFIAYAQLYTRRQASKFLKARGVVFNHINPS